MSSILVTGGAGYIGSHVCKALARAGYLPVTYDNLTTGHRWAVKWGPLEVGDIQDQGRLSAVLKQYQTRAAIHLAGSAYVGESMSDPGKYWRNNVSASATMMEAFSRHQIHHLVFSSTCAVYGVPERLPIDETFPTKPVNTYGKTKLAIEAMLDDFDRAFGIRHVCLRYFNAAGADPEGEVGESHQPETHVLPNLIAAALDQSKSFQVFGDDYQTRDGTCIRDFVHVSDLADAHVLALKYLEDSGHSVAVNLATSRGVSVRELITATESCVGQRPQLRICPRRAGDPPELVASAARAKKLLSWRPSRSDLSSIITSAKNWMCDSGYK